MTRYPSGREFLPLLPCRGRGHDGGRVPPVQRQLQGDWRQLAPLRRAAGDLSVSRVAVLKQHLKYGRELCILGQMGWIKNSQDKSMRLIIADFLVLVLRNIT